MLTADAINEFELELTAKRVMADWLGRWFDGAEHFVPGRETPVSFPRVSLGFDTGQPVQPLDSADGHGCEIRVVMHTGSHRRYTGPDGWDAFANVRFDFWVRGAKSGRADEPGSAALSAQIAGLLFGLLNNPDCHADPDTPTPRSSELARLGVTHLRPRPPLIVPMDAYTCRFITCTALLLYPIYDPRLTGPSGVAPVSGGEPISGVEP